MSPASKVKAWGRTGSKAVRFSTAPLGLPGRLTTSDDPQVPAIGLERAARGVARIPSLSIRNTSPGADPVENGLGGFRRHVPGSESGAAGCDDQAGLSRQVFDSLAYFDSFVRNGRSCDDGVSLGFQQSDQGCPGDILAVTAGNSIRHRQDRGGMRVDRGRVCPLGQVPFKIERSPDGGATADPIRDDPNGCSELPRSLCRAVCDDRA